MVLNNTSVTTILILTFMQMFFINCGKTTKNNSEITPEEKKNIPVAYVNGYPISQQLHAMRMKRNRALVHRDICIKYGVEDCPDFWQTKFGGEETPTEVLSELALKECVNIKIQQILAKEKGVVDNISYSAFLRKFNKENLRRKKAIENGQPVYGPTQYKEHDYFDYLFKRQVIDLKRLLATTEFRPDDESLRIFYDSVKDEWYKKADTIVIQMISIPMHNSMREINNKTKEKAMKTILKAQMDLEAATPFDVAAKLFNPDGEIIEKYFKASNNKESRIRYATLLEEASKLAEGDISGIFEFQQSYNIIKCTERKDGKCVPFEEVKNNVRKYYIDREYNMMISNLSRDATVTTRDVNTHPKVQR